MVVTWLPGLLQGISLSGYGKSLKIRDVLINTFISGNESNGENEKKADSKNKDKPDMEKRFFRAGCRTSLPGLSCRAFFISWRYLMNATNTKETRKQGAPMFRKTIGQTTYLVRVHFSETSRDTLADKIKRLLREEAMKM